MSQPVPDPDRRDLLGELADVRRGGLMRALSVPCDDHHAATGAPCYSLPSAVGRPHVGVCASRMGRLRRERQRERDDAARAERRKRERERRATDDERTTDAAHDPGHARAHGTGRLAARVATAPAGAGARPAPPGAGRPAARPEDLAARADEARAALAAGPGAGRARAAPSPTGQAPEGDRSHPVMGRG